MSRPATPPVATAPPLLLLGLGSFVSLSSMRACDSILPTLSQHFHASIGAAAQTISAFAIAYGVLQIVYGPLGDRFNKSWVIAWATLACAAANLGAALATSVESLIVWRTLAGAAGGGIVPLSLALIGDTVAYEHRQIALTRLSLATITGLIAGQWLGGLVAETLGWRAVFFALAAGFAAVAVALMRSVRRTAAFSTQGPTQAAQSAQAAQVGSQPTSSAASTGLISSVAQMAAVLRVPWARVVLASVAIEGAFAFAAFAFVPTHLHDAFGLSPGQAGSIVALYGLGGLVWVWLAKPLIARLGERGLARVGGGLVGLGLGGLAFVPTWQMAVPGCLIGGLGVYMLHSTLQTHATQMLPHRRGTAVAMFALCLFGAQSLGVAIGAWVVDHASARAIFIAALIALPVLGWGFAAALASRGRVKETA